MLSDDEGDSSENRHAWVGTKTQRRKAVQGDRQSGPKAKVAGSTPVCPHHIIVWGNELQVRMGLNEYHIS